MYISIDCMSRFSNSLASTVVCMSRAEKQPTIDQIAAPEEKLAEQCMGEGFGNKNQTLSIYRMKQTLMMETTERRTK